MELVFKSSNLKQLDQLKQAILNEIPCYRITDIEVLEYKSEVPFEVFKEKLKYIPLPEVFEFINKEINDSPDNTEIVSFSTGMDSYNQGNLNLRFTITKGTGADHPGFSTIKDMRWIPEQGVLGVVPNIDYEGNIEVIRKLDELSTRFPEVEFPELRPDLRIPAINTVVNTIKWLPYVEKIYIFGSRARGDNDERAGIDIAVECPNATEEEESFLERMIEEALVLQDVHYRNIDQIRKTSTRKGALEELVLLYSRNKNIDQIKEYGNYQILEQNLSKTLKVPDINTYNSYRREKIHPLLCLLRYLPFVKEVYYFQLINPGRVTQYYSLAIYCPDATEEDLYLLQEVREKKGSSTFYYRMEELKEGSTLMKLFKNTSVLIAKRS